MAMRSSLTHDPKREKKKAPIIHVTGWKGGVGKSFTNRTIAGLLQLWGYSIAGFDGDANNAHFERYYGSVIEVGRPYLRDVNGWSEMIDAWQSAPDTQVILIDLPAGIGEVIRQEQQRILLASKALNREIIEIWVADEEEDSVRLFKSSPRLASPGRTIFMMNGRFGAKPTDFVIWQESQTRAHWVARGVREMLLPALPIRARTRIARAHAPFHPLPEIGFTLSEKIDFDMWWANAELACRGIRDMIEEAVA